MAIVVPLAFSPNGEYLAYSSPDGTLKLWETATGNLKQQYTPSSHLSATCSCLCWSSPRQSSETPRKKKKRKSSGEAATENVDLLALGTTSGSILLYNLVQGDLQTQLTEGHSDTVHCVCWQPSGDSLYSCSSDQHITEWSVTSAKVKHKWKADKGPVYSVCVCTGGRHLLSASRIIKLWDLQTKLVLKTFTGHATEVFRLLSVPPGGGDDHSIDGTYFLSAAVNDRLVSAWQVDTSSKDKNSVASFTLPEEPVHIDISSATNPQQPSLLAAVTKTGQLLIFEHILNGRIKKPLKPQVTIHVASQANKDDIPKPIPILSVRIADNQDQNIQFAHGNFLKPTFEKQAYGSMEHHEIYIRTDPASSVVKTQATVSKVKTPQVSGDVTVLAPGHMAPSGPSRAEGQDSKGKKKRRKSSVELTMEERLHAISIDKPGEERGAASQPPRADALATLLAQGLQSQDKKILNNVLQNRNETIIRNTVKRLPVPVIIPLVQELSRRMHGHAQSGHTLVKWVKTVLTIHTSYLMTFPELVDTFSSLYQMMDSRVAVFSRLSRLQGKLDLMLSQISSQTQEEAETLAMQQPLLVYQDESSDEDLMMEDIVPDHSESEDNWEELSDMDVGPDEGDSDGDDGPGEGDSNDDDADAVDVNKESDSSESD